MAQNIKREDKIDERAREMFGAHPDLQAREKAAGNGYVDSGVDQAEAYANDPANASQNIDDVKNRENQYNYQPSESKPRDSRNLRQKVVSFATSRKGATTGIFGGVGIIGIVLSSLFGSFSMFPSIQANGLDTLDSRSPIMENRLVKWLEKKSSSGDSSGCKVTKYECRMGKMPNKMLSRLAIQGVKPLDADGKEIKLTSESGYIDKNPAKYEIPDTLADGGKRTINASELAKEYKRNPELRSAFKKSYSMRYRAWTGKYIKKVFYSIHGLAQNGGIASDDKKLNADNVDDELDKKLDSSSTDEVNANKKALFRDRFKNIIDRSGEKVKKTGGDPVLAVGAAYCTAVNVPGLVAGVYRAVQLAQILLLINDAVLSPAGKIKAGDAKPEEVSALGSTLTETVDGKSALDSAILLSAIGVNKKKTTPSEYAPGYAAYSSAFVKGSNGVSSKSKGFCNKILSPEASYAAAGVEGAIAVGTGGTGAIVMGALKGILTLAIKFKLLDLTLSALKESGVIDIIASQAFELTKGFVGNYVEGARGEKLGDALGVGLFSYFSMSGLAGGGGVLKTNQVVAFNQAAEDVENDYRQEALATLSPFDISSKYTFMGSIVSGLSTSGVLSNNLFTSMSSIGSFLLRTPGSIISPTAGATPEEDTAAAQARCSHASMFDIEDDIAINPAGYPCVGIPAEYLNMSVDEVYKIATEEEDANINNETGMWDENDSKIADRLADCANADLESVGGCTIDNKTKAAESLYQYDKQVSDILDGSDDEPLTSNYSGTGAQFRVASFNILHADDPMPWQGRLKDSIQTLKDNNIDIAGLQEARPKQQVALKSTEYGADVYDMWPTKAGDGADLDVNPDSVVLWNKTKFEFVSAQQKKIRYDGNRKLNVVKLRYVENGANGPEFYVLNTHDPIDRRADAAGGPQDRKDNNEMYVDLVKNELSDAPVIFTGDFNSKMTVDASGNKPLGGERSNLAYCILTRDELLWHVSDAQQNKTGECPSERDVRGNNLIDHIFISTSMRASNYGYVKGGKDEDGSDHNMVYSDVEIPSTTGLGATGSISASGFAWPVDKKWWTSNRGDFLDGHTMKSRTFTGPSVYGLADDISTPRIDSPIYSMLDGTVTRTNLCGLGDGMIIESDTPQGKLQIAYGHGISPKFEVGDSVKAGQQILSLNGVGCQADGTHLHIDMALGDKHICPQDIFLAMGEGSGTIDLEALTKKAVAPCAR